MADLNPLKFAVEIEDLATAKLNEIKTSLNELKDVKIKIDVIGNKVSVSQTLQGVVQQATASLSAESKVIKESSENKKQNAQATQHLGGEMQNLTQSVINATQSMRSQIGVLSDLKSMAQQYLGVWGSQQFVRNIIETGGQLEMQRLSIGAILQNQSQANTLFNQIKSLAIRSPFGVVELDQMSKQLTAYGFKYAGLYDWTKRLADISAATGTSVGRLALALGHVRSEAALSGYTLRQFSMGNIPLLEKLAEKLGKTTKEIREMTRKKEISYEDVAGVLKDLTDEGGMFYNMQEVISQSVKAKFKNVRDAMDIMYGEMAEGGMGDALKGVADILMKLTQNWREMLAVIAAGSVAWQAARFYTTSYTAAVGKATAAYTKQIDVMRRNVTTLRRLHIAERGHVIAARQSIVANTASALYERRLTLTGLQHAVALGKISKAQAIVALKGAGMWDVQTAAALRHIAVLKGVDRQLAIVGFGLKRIGLSIARFLTSPMFLFSAALGGILSLITHQSHEMSRIEDAANGIFAASRDALQKNRSMLNDMGAKLTLAGKEIDLQDVTIKNMPEVSLPPVNTEDAEESISQYIDFLRANAPTPNRIIKNALYDESGKELPITEQLRNLQHEVIYTAEAMQAMGDLSDIFEAAGKATDTGFLWGAFNDDMFSNMKDHSTDLKNLSATITQVYQRNGKVIEESVRKLESQNKIFREATKSCSTYAQKFEFLMKHYKEFQAVSGEFFLKDFLPNDGFKREDIVSTQDGLDDVFSNIKELADSREELEADFEKFYENLKAGLEKKGLDITKMGKVETTALLSAFKKYLEGAENASEETVRFMLKLFSVKFNIPIDIDDVPVKVKGQEVQDMLNSLVKGDYTIDINTVTNIEDVVAKTRKTYDKLKEFYANQKPVMLRFGISMGKALTEEEIQKRLVKVPEEQRPYFEKLFRAFNEAAKAWDTVHEAAKTGGFSLEDPNKKKNNRASHKRYEDTEAERLKQRIRLIQEASREYKYWEEKIGKDAAQARVKKSFAALIGADKELEPGDLDNLENYGKTLERIQEIVNKRYEADQKLGKGEKKDIRLKNDIDLANTLAKALNDIVKTGFESSSKDWASDLKNQLDDLTQRWELFKRIVEDTGDRELAKRITGIVPGATPADLKRANIASFAGIKIDFDSVLEMSDEEIKDYVQSLDLPKEKIDAVVDGLKEWKKAQKDVSKSDIEDYAKWLGSLADVQSILTRNQDEYNKVLEETNRLLKEGKISEEEAERRRKAAAVTKSNKDFAATSTYFNLYNNAQVMGRKEFEDAYKKARDIQDKRLASGEIDIQKYIEEIEKLNKARSAFDSGGFLGIRGGVGAFLSGGYEGLIDYHRNKAKELRANGKDKEAREEDEKAQKMEAANQAAQQVTKAFQELSSVANMLAGVFDSLGMSGAADAMSGAADVLGGVASGASSLSFLGPYGMAAGAALGGISAISQQHDKRIERQIEKIRENIEKIESNTKLIKQARERTLGIDTGELRRSYAAQYAPDPQLAASYAAYVREQMRKGGIFVDSNKMEGYQNGAQRSMYEYYNRNSAGSGYAQEYANLKEERESYLQMLDKQQRKKKKSNSEIEATKAKIAELDDQIRYFTLDLAKELFSIDIKGWADQISDALTSAWENGESRAKAYKDTVREILQQVSSDMKKKLYLEKMFSGLEDQISDLFDPDNVEASAPKMMEAIAKWFGPGGEGEKAIIASQAWDESLEALLNKYGLSLKNDSANTLSSSLQGTTEETSGLIAGYINTLRQDVAANRLEISQFVEQQWPEYVDAFIVHTRTVANIDSNVRIVMEMMRDGRGAMYEQLAAMRSRIDNVVNGVESFAMK